MKPHHAQLSLLSYRRRPVSIIKHVMQWKMASGLHRGDGDSHVTGNLFHRLVFILSLAIMPLSSLIGGILYLLACVWRIYRPEAGSKSLSMKLGLKQKPVWFWSLVGFCLLSLFPLLFSAHPLWHLTGWISHYALPGLLIYGQVRGLKSGRFQTEDLLIGLLAGSGLLAGVGLLNYFFHWQTHTQLICFQAYGGFCLLDLLLLAEERARSFSMHPNVLGALMSLAIPLWLYVIYQVKSAKAKLGAASVLALVLLCLLVSYSRTAWISGGISLGMGLILFLRPRLFKTEGFVQDFTTSFKKMDSGEGPNDESVSRNDNSRRVIALVLFAPLLVVLTQVKAISMRWQALWQGNGSSQTRWQLWQAGWQMLQDHLWFGTGLLQLEPLLKSYLPVLAGGAGHLHNWYLQVAVESGLPAALCLFFSLFVYLTQLSINAKYMLNRVAALMLWSALIASLFDIALLDFRVLFVLCWACTLAVLDYFNWGSYSLFSRHK